MRILFLDKKRDGGSRVFDFNDLETLRGGERCVLYLAESLAKRGHDVVLASLMCKDSLTQRRVNIVDLKTALSGRYDVAISNNYAHAFDDAKTTARIIWTHNPGFSRAHVKADFLGKLRHHPYIVHLSKYTRNRSWFLPQSGNTIIHHGQPSCLLENRKERERAPAPIALFSSTPERNLAMVVKAWREVVHPQLPQARLEVTAEVEPKHVCRLPKNELEQLNVSVVGTRPWSELMDLMRRVRVLVVPGHRQETYNMLAVEAAANGVPTVTVGIGALRERVLHEQTGWVATSVREMGSAIVRLLSDDALWFRYHRACLSHPDLVSWDDCAECWEACMRGLIK